MVAEHVNTGPVCHTHASRITTLSMFATLECLFCREVHKNFILGHRHAGSGSTVQEPVYSLYEDRPHTTLSDRFVQSLSTKVSNGETIEEAALKVAAELSDRENVIQAKEEVLQSR